MSLPWYWTPLLFASFVALPRIIAWWLGGRKGPTTRKPQFEPDPLAPAHAVLAAFWARGGDNPTPHAKAMETVRDLEQRYGVVLPEDFCTYLLIAAPAADYWDEGSAIWWSPERIHSLAEEPGDPLGNPALAARAQSCLLFADYMDWCWAWAICCEQGRDYGKVALISGEGHWVADSFSDFVRCYTRDPMSAS